MTRVLSVIFAFAMPIFSTALGNHELSNEKLDCTVTEVGEGSMHSFIPPEVGDVLFVDLAVERFESTLRFSRSPMGTSYISLAALSGRALIKVPSRSEWDKHMAVYDGNAVNPVTGDETAIQLVVGHYSDDAYRAEVQILEKRRRLPWEIEQLKMLCVASEGR